MQLPPPSVLLSFPPPNYAHPQVQGHGIIFVYCILFPLAMVTVILRLFTRIKLSKSFGIDDWLLVSSTIPAIAVAILTSLGFYQWGWNRHVWDVPPDMFVLGLKLNMALECTAALAVALMKLSCLVLIRRIMAYAADHIYKTTGLAMAFVAVQMLVFNSLVIFSCIPVSDYWTISSKPQKCINGPVFLLVGGAFNTLTDFVVFGLPIPTLLRLKLPLRQRIVLSCLFGAGLCVCAAGTTRMIFTYRVSRSYDRTWNSYYIQITGMIEIYLGIICTAAPPIKQFFSYYMPSVFGSDSKLHEEPYYYSQQESSARATPILDSYVLEREVMDMDDIMSLNFTSRRKSSVWGLDSLATPKKVVISQLDGSTSFKSFA